MQFTDRHFVGVDVGGTKVAAGLVDSSGKITRHTRTPMVATDAVAGLAAVTSAMGAVYSAADLSPQLKSSISGVGICAPGPLNPQTGVIINPPNLPGWRNFPLAAEISKAYSLPVRGDNDGNAAALAEALWGSGRHYRNGFYATLGAGIGSCFLFACRIYHGPTAAAAARRHMDIHP